MSDKLNKLANKLSNKYAQQAAVAPAAAVVAGNPNYVKLMDAYSRLMVNVAAGVGAQAQIAPIAANYKSTAAQTSPENAKLVTEGIRNYLDTLQSNVNEIKQLLAAVGNA